MGPSPDPIRTTALGHHDTGGVPTCTPTSAAALLLEIDQPDDRSLVLRVTGEIDSVSGSTLADGLTAALSSGREVDVDLDAVTFVSSSGLAVLLEARDRAAEAGTGLSLICAGMRPVSRALHATGSWEVFDVREPEADRVPEQA